MTTDGAPKVMFVLDPYHFYEDGCGHETCVHDIMDIPDASARYKLHYEDEHGAFHRLAMDVCGACYESEVYREARRYKLVTRGLPGSSQSQSQSTSN